MSFNYTEWKKKYYNKKVYDVFKIFNEKEINIIKKLGIKIENKIYTEYEFENMKFEILKYLVYNDMEEERKEVKSLDKIGVTLEEYNKIIKN